MTQEGAENVVVVKGPVHDPVLVVTLAGTENALVVVRETHEIHTIVLVVVCVYFLSPLEVVECDGVVITAGYQVLAIV